LFGYRLAAGSLRESTTTEVTIMRRGACAGALIAALAFGAFGCGGGGGESDTVKNTVKSFFTALANRDGKKACALLSKASVQATQVGGGDCAKALKSVSVQAVPDNKRDEAKNIEVTSVKLRGTTAIAVAKGKKGTQQLTLVKEGGKWKFASL
jgi:hypothetical protein